MAREACRLQAVVGSLNKQRVDEPLKSLPTVCPQLLRLCSPLKITVRDGAGEGGASLLAEDALTVELRAGPPAQLSVEGPGTLEVGTKAALPQLRVRVCDSAGNPTTSETFEVGRAWVVGRGWQQLCMQGAGSLY